MLAPTRALFDRHSANASERSPCSPPRTGSCESGISTHPRGYRCCAARKCRLCSAIPLFLRGKFQPPRGVFMPSASVNTLGPRPSCSTFRPIKLESRIASPSALHGKPPHRFDGPPRPHPHWASTLSITAESNQPLICFMLQPPAHESRSSQSTIQSDGAPPRPESLRSAIPDRNDDALGSPSRRRIGFSVGHPSRQRVRRPVDSTPSIGNARRCRVKLVMIPVALLPSAH